MCPSRARLPSALTQPRGKSNACSCPLRILADGTLNQDTSLVFRIPGDEERWVLGTFDGHGLLVCSRASWAVTVALHLLYVRCGTCTRRAFALVRGRGITYHQQPSSALAHSVQGGSNSKAHSHQYETLKGLSFCRQGEEASRVAAKAVNDAFTVGLVCSVQVHVSFVFSCS